MSCSICALKNNDLKRTIESFLLANGGVLNSANRSQLKYMFSEDAEAIDNITDTDCTNHFNFHYAQSREPEVTTPQEQGAKKSSLTADINKDEANILYELANTQMATFNLLTNRINEALQNPDDEMSSTILHPTAVQLYRETAESIRETVANIKDLNSSINGSADSATEGLKALAHALHPAESTSASAIEGPTKDDLSTDKFDY